MDQEVKKINTLNESEIKSHTLDTALILLFHAALRRFIEKNSDSDAAEWI